MGPCKPLDESFVVWNSNQQRICRSAVGMPEQTTGLQLNPRPNFALWWVDDGEQVNELVFAAR